MIDNISKAYRWFGCLGLLVLFAETASAQQTEFPYRATVISEGAVVRSGPGKTHYGTDRLAPGTEVEVHRNDPGGWMAIRPPDGSFSLVQRHEIDLYENGLAKVKATNTKAWIGTRLNPVKRPLFQVKLRPGEMLEVLGVVDRDQFELGQDQPDWVQIEPPKGEFRWIAAADIQAVVGALTEQPSDDSPSFADESASFHMESFPDIQSSASDQGPAPFDSWEPKQNPTVAVSGEWDLKTESDRITASDQTPGFQSTSNATPAPLNANGWKPARQTISNFVDERSGFVAESAAGNNLIQPYENIQRTTNPGAGTRSGIFDATDSPTTFPVSQASSSQSAMLLAPTFGNPALQSLEMRLTQEMLKQPAEWNLMPLAAELEQLRNAISTQQDMNTFDRLMEKIRSCREIQAGYRATGSGGPVDLQTMRNRGLVAGAGVPPTSAAADGLLYNYDAHGYLNELVRDGGVGPKTYVLQDETGKVTHHISAPPGVNLRTFLNQRVGIIGSRGFHQQLKLNHVTAERVIALDTLRR